LDRGARGESGGGGYWRCSQLGVDEGVMSVECREGRVVTWRVATDRKKMGENRGGGERLGDRGMSLRIDGGRSPATFLVGRRALPYLLDPL